ncbi:MATE family efflux transporter [Loktanella sp. F6476L]|uniref:MATE family efflux transporter n=1 Tax=Loktanella sp. F6476L TaxID=2926405 RepID=UPI001FF31725|nr:MATE family efflux transporter [Loktanella sp. F6476L]MCK0120054.1 MATE family efflux transporter [Loktanella sp. F6476L]
MKIDSLTHRRVLQISLPIVLSNATVPILGAVDTGVVGQMGEAAPIGAVGIGAIILTAFYWIFGFLRMGTAGLAAQAHGAGDQPEVAALLSRALLIGATAGFAMILLQIPLFYGAFNLSPASPEVESLAREYMAIRVWSAPATIALYGITGWLVALERTKAILAIQVLMNGANIILDLVFVLGFDWGVAGVGWATFIAEWAGLALGLWLCRDAFKGTAWRNTERIFDRIRLKNMAVVNTDIMIRSVLLQAIFVSFLFWGADFGDVNLAANQVLLQFLYITSYAQDGFAFAAESLVGQALGAKKRAALRRAAILTFGWGAATGLLLATCFAIFGPAIIDTMAKAPEVQSAGRTFLPYMIAAPLVGVASWMLDGIFIGATRTKDMRNMMIISALVYFACVFPLMAAFGNHGLWLGLLLSFVVRGITLGMKYPALEAAADP